MKSLYALILLCTLSFSAQAAPQFKDYPVDVYSGVGHNVVLNKETRLFKTRFKEAGKASVNFAGKYVMSSVGCGTACVSYFYVDKKSGLTNFIPENLQPDYNDMECENEVYYKPNSRLFIASSVLNGACSVAYYEFLDGEFKLIETQPFKGAPQ